MNYIFSMLAKDSVNVDSLKRIYVSLGDRVTFVSDVIAAMRLLEPAHAWRSVWLLRRSARDRKLGEHAELRIAEFANEAPHWIARLNLCQLFSHTGCPRPVRVVLYPFLVECFADRRVMVKAWAISALASFGDDPDYKGEIAEMMRESKNDPRKAMRARLRHINSSRPGARAITITSPQVAPTGIVAHLQR